MTTSLRRVLIEHAAVSCGVTVGLAAIAAIAVGQPVDALSAVIGGVLAALDFGAIVWIVTGLLAPGTSAPSKAALGILMIGKLGFVGALLWSAIVRHGLDGFGIPLGIAAGLAGFTWGMVRGQASPAGQAAIAAEERQLAAGERAPARLE